MILLHGWLGSWGLWQDTMTFLGDSYRTYALDFWGFGESGKKRDSYSINDFVSLVDEFMEILGIAEAPIVGHSMGGTVSLSVAMQYPQRVKKVVVIGSPIEGSSLSLVLKLAGYRAIAFSVHNMLWALKLALRVSRPVITKDKNWPSMINEDLSKTTLDSFLLSISSLRQTDLSKELDRVQAPTMGIYGDRDVFVNPNQWRVLHEGQPNAKIERLNKAGHFPMLDEPERFRQTLKGFLDAE